MLHDCLIRKKGCTVGDNLRIFFNFSIKIIDCEYSSEAPNEALMITHDICFCEELEEIISE